MTKGRSAACTPAASLVAESGTGYDVVPGDDRGRRTMIKAEIVRRIYRETLEGRSALAIVKGI